MKLITTSRLRVAQACLMKHHLRYRMRVERVTSDEGTPRRFGTLWHDGQENYYKSLRVGASQLGAVELASERMVENGGDPFDIAKAVTLLERYDRYWADVTESWRVLAVEVEFRIPLVNPSTGRASRTYELGGKIDAIIEIDEGLDAGLYVVEHKTSTEDISPGSLYWRRLRLDDQITIYIDGARALGYPVRGVIYDVVLRPGQEPAKATPPEKLNMTKGKPCKLCSGTGTIHVVASALESERREHCNACDGTKWAEAPRPYANQRLEDETTAEHSARVASSIERNPDRYFRRPPAPIVRLPDELDRMRQNIWHHCQRLIADARSDWHPLSTSSCGDFFRLCEYFDACTGDAEISDRTVYQIRDRAHPELSLETQTEEPST